MSRRGSGPIGRGRSSEQRFARRAWSRRWATVRRVVLLLLVVALVGGAGWLVFASSVLAVEQVEVSGVHTVSAERISRAAAVPLGEPLARVDVDRVRDRVEEVPVVARAEIGRSWPHTVSVEVVERTPVAVVRKDGAFSLTDAEGVMYRTVASPRRRLPVVTVGPDPQTLPSAATVVAELPPLLARRVSHVRAATIDSIELRLRDGRSVVWGSAESSQLKAEVLESLLRRRASVYDVSVPGAPTLQVD
jgi:cell division protein FtsQ